MPHLCLALGLGPVVQNKTRTFFAVVDKTTWENGLLEVQTSPLCMAQQYCKCNLSFSPIRVFSVEFGKVVLLGKRFGDANYIDWVWGGKL